MRQRYTELPFPPYAYLPGQNAHPNRDPAGHSFKKPEPELSDHEFFLYGIDLFNGGFYWEAHETWEMVWKRSKGNNNETLFLQLLIQFAACCLKYILGNKEGVEKLSRASLEKLKKIKPQVGMEYWGVNLDEVQAQILSVVSSQEFTPPEIRLRLGSK